MSSREATSPNTRNTTARARTVRAEHAIAAALYANRVERARASSRPGAAARLTAEYLRSTTSYRRLGEILRSEREAA